MAHAKSKRERRQKKVLKLDELKQALAAYTDARLASTDSAAVVTEAELGKLSTEALMIEAGEKIYSQHCVVCHLERGQGKTGPNATTPSAG